MSQKRKQEGVHLRCMKAQLNLQNTVSYEIATMHIVKT